MYTKYEFYLFYCAYCEGNLNTNDNTILAEKGVRLQTAQKPVVGGRSMSQEDHSSDEHHTAHTTSSHHSLAHSIHSHPSLR